MLNLKQISLLVSQLCRDICDASETRDCTHERVIKSVPAKCVLLLPVNECHIFGIESPKMRINSREQQQNASNSVELKHE